MTHRSGGKGTLLLDRIFPGLGRIKRASGTMDRRIHDALNGMLSQLWAAGRTDVLASIRDGDLHPLEVFGRVQVEGGVRLLPTAEEVEPFATDWIEKVECSDHYRRDLGSYMRCFLVDREGLTVGGLPAALASYREDMGEKPVMFNRTKSALQGYLKRRFGQHHPLWMALSNVPSMDEDPDHGNPQSVEQLTALTARMEEPFRRIAWSMALTGMGPKEYWGKWRVVTGAVQISGTKTSGRVRMVPVLGDLFRPMKTLGLFEDALKAASDDAVKPYDMRRTFAVWMDLAGISWTHIRLYMGHRAQSVTDRYLWREVMQHIPADGKQARAWLKSQQLAARTA